MYKITVCIPTFSRLNFLKEAFSSSAANGSDKVQILIGVDPHPERGPNLDIINWCKEITNDNFYFFVNDKNLGLAGNWNALVNKAQGEYLIIIGDDDRLSKNFIPTMLNVIEKEGPDVIFSNQCFINEKGDVVKENGEDLNIKFGRGDLNPGILNEPEKVVWNNSVPMSSSLTKKDWLVKFPFKDYSNTPELEVFLNIARSGGKFYFVSEKLSEYRIHETSATSVGLRLHYLFKDLESVNTSHEDLKIKFLNRIAVPAVNICLRQNQIGLAKKIYYSKYYPFRLSLKPALQFILLYCPDFFRKLVLK